MIKEARQGFCGRTLRGIGDKIPRHPRITRVRDAFCQNLPAADGPSSKEAVGKEGLGENLRGLVVGEPLPNGIHLRRTGAIGCAEVSEKV